MERTADDEDWTTLTQAGKGGCLWDSLSAKQRNTDSGSEDDMPLG